MKKSYPLFRVHIPTESALRKVKEVFSSGFINEGEQVTELTKKLSERMKTDKLILLNSCTSALTVALKLAGVGPGDEVITTAMTCVATNIPIKNLGATIVWADIDVLDGMIDAYNVVDKITPKTKAVMAVAWAGTPPALAALKALCKAHNVKLILDAAHAFDATYRDLPVHEWADYTCYSFQAIKHFTTGDGGGLVCNDNVDYERSKALKWFGIDRDASKDDKGNWKGQHWDVDIPEVGWKFNMNNVSAAIGLAQLPLIDGLIATHRHNAQLYANHFKGHYSVVHGLNCPPGGNSSYWVYTMLIENGHDRDELLLALNNDGIHAGVVHVPNHDYTCFADSKVPLPGVEKFAQNQFSIPCGWWMSDNDVAYVAKRVKFHLGVK
jgi:dTDP-4-amino-4,6-dideoxygalactose transaminase